MTGIILGLLILMILAYLGWSIVWVAPIAAGVVALGGGLDLFDSYTNVYMGGFVAFAKTWFPVFMLGAIFGKLMEITSMANSVSLAIGKILGEKRAILGVILSAAILTYGGVSLFVVVFAVYPLALSLFRKANIPRRLIPPTIALGAFTFTMAALPGSPQIQNLIPIKYFDTTAMAAPIMGIISGLIMLLGGYFYLKYRENYFKNLGEFYDEPDEKHRSSLEQKVPNFILSLVPLLCVVVLLNLFSFEIINALLCGILAILILNVHRFKDFIQAINAGAQGSIIAIINTSAAVGFGSVVKAVPGFQTLTHLLLGFKTNPLISEAIAVNLLAGATGSASGGMGIALEALGAKYKEIALNENISLELFHRVASISSGGLDALPHNGAVLTLLVITGMSHKKSYLDICVVAVIIPIIALIVGIIFAYFGIY
ncbi:GntP family permease [Campylobacter sp. VicNov18]|uniref:GntP family permease n=1 Tax=Campylobacter bilis TaxID=2691918 RepID=UPI00130E0A53|nr:GntP family permease [Campylobacter bilis]MPV63419.1 GntP family permease [Campylobacter hepaticus]MBM0636918.1 GntP family permease [Campylobacter bilis]MCC8277630.1 GntP family permease [Campylobacter bilis]MCC8299239.1 GntP family permease [Campylobacter bilis]MCC8300539.1 GntP family permease [Campylobacter bilis]